MMIDHIKRDRSDIYGWPLIGFLFKNPAFLIILKISVALLFAYAIAYGFIDDSTDNVFTTGIFWGLFWPFFMVITLSSMGRVFCGICPHGFLGKYITRFGLKKKMPKPLQNPFIGLLILFFGWWAVYYAFPVLFKTPYATAMLFAMMTAVAFVFYFLFRDMAYCKSVCPIGIVSRAFSKISFTRLGTYKSECDSCRTFECASACSHNLKPFTFDSRNSMTDCTLCMDCAGACEAVSFKVQKPSRSLFQKFQVNKAEVWSFILIAGAITITMNFHHALSRTALADEFIWAKTARYFETFMSFGSADAVGIFAFVYAMAATLFLTMSGMFIASRMLKQTYSKTFYTLGYAFAPIFIIGGLSHMGEFFFYRYASEIVNAFIQAFALPYEYIRPLATRRDKWVHVFSLFNYLAVIWALILLYGRMKQIDAKKMMKIAAFPFAAAFILFYLWLNFYKGHVFATYGPYKGKGGHQHGHHAHGSAQMFQSVSPDKAILLQSGPDKTEGVVCGMKLPMFYKTNHAAILDGKERQYCSLHCLAEDLKIKQLPLENIRVVDTETLQFIPAAKAYYVVGSSQKGTMSRTSKYAFGSEEKARAFANRHSGEIRTFEAALTEALKDFRQ